LEYTFQEEQLAYPSSVIMNAVPAIVAGVKNITLCMPTPNNKINAGVVYAAKICGVKKDL
jgi:histidinol dehydrogenase